MKIGLQKIIFVSGIALLSATVAQACEWTSSMTSLLTATDKPECKSKMNLLPLEYCAGTIRCTQKDNKIIDTVVLCQAPGHFTCPEADQCLNQTVLTGNPNRLKKSTKENLSILEKNYEKTTTPIYDNSDRNEYKINSMKGLTAGGDPSQSIIIAQYDATRREYPDKYNSYSTSRLKTYSAWSVCLASNGQTLEKCMHDSCIIVNPKHNYGFPTIQNYTTATDNQNAGTSNKSQKAD